MDGLPPAPIFVYANGNSEGSRDAQHLGSDCREDRSRHQPAGFRCGPTARSRARPSCSCGDAAQLRAVPRLRRHAAGHRADTQRGARPRRARRVARARFQGSRRRPCRPHGPAAGRDRSAAHTRRCSIGAGVHGAEIRTAAGGSIARVASALPNTLVEQVVRRSSSCPASSPSPRARALPSTTGSLRTSRTRSKRNCAGC